MYLTLLRFLQNPWDPAKAVLRGKFTVTEAYFKKKEKSQISNIIYHLMTNLDSILKSRDITLPTKVHLVKAMVFPVVMYGCERRIDAFELWYW